MHAFLYKIWVYSKGQKVKYALNLKKRGGGQSESCTTVCRTRLACHVRKVKVHSSTYLQVTVTAVKWGYRHPEQQTYHHPMCLVLYHWTLMLRASHLGRRADHLAKSKSASSLSDRLTNWAAIKTQTSAALTARGVIETWNDGERERDKVSSGNKHVTCKAASTLCPETESLPESH